MKGCQVWNSRFRVRDWPRHLGFMPEPIPITPAARQRLEDAILNEIERLGDAVWELRHVDREVLDVGMDALGNEAALAMWLVQPSAALDRGSPLSVLAGAEGRKEVLGLLLALAGAGQF